MSLRRVILTVVAVSVAGAVVYKAVRAARIQEETFAPPRDVGAPPPDPDGKHPLRDVSFRAEDGTTLRGWWAPSRNGAAIVLAHGSPSNRREMLPDAMALAEHGYGALVFDFPGHGESGGAVNWNEGARAALRAAIGFAASGAGDGATRVGVLGRSMGAVIAARVTADDPRVAALAMVGAFTDMREQLRYEFKAWGPITWLPAIWVSARGGIDLDDMRCLAAMPKIAPRPLLVVGGEADTVVPPWMPRALFDAAGEPKALWMIPGARHNHWRDAAGPDVYDARMRDFFDRALLARR